MEWYNYLSVFIAGAAGGAINTVSAAGSLVTLPALQFAGLPPQVANATNRIGILSQNTAAIIGYHKEGVPISRKALQMALVTLPGGVIGAFFSLKIPDEWFNTILSVVMVFFLALLVFFPVTADKKIDDENENSFWGYFLYFLSGIYGGLIQAGAGFILMATTIYVNRMGIIQSNYYKVLAMLTYTIGAFAVFIWGGEIDWIGGFFLAAGNFAGAYISSRLSVKAGEKKVRMAIFLIVAGMAILLWFS